MDQPRWDYGQFVIKIREIDQPKFTVSRFLESQHSVEIPGLKASTSYNHPAWRGQGPQHSSPCCGGHHGYTTLFPTPGTQLVIGIEKIPRSQGLLSKLLAVQHEHSSNSRRSELEFTLLAEYSWVSHFISLSLLFSAFESEIILCLQNTAMSSK